MSEGTSAVHEEERAPLQPPKTQVGRPPFRLWFSITKPIGRSCMSLSHPLGLEVGVSGKFYSIRETSCESEPDVDSVKRLYNSGPKEKYPGHYPPLESHKYGWYTSVRFIDEDILRDTRLNHHRKTSNMFKTVTSGSKV